MATATSLSDPGAFFDDDDEETLRCLVANDIADPSFSPRLESLVKRFQEDYDHSSAQNERWNELTSAATSRGFQLSESFTRPSDSNNNDNATASFPSAFDSENGKKHLLATTALLSVSERIAVQLTMSSLRNLNETTNLQALLGTRTLLEKVMEYHFRQRVARLAAITECLRKEQDDSTDGSHDAEKIAVILDSIDVTYQQDDGKNRGVFRYLLSIACQRESGQSPSREQLQPAKDLHSDNPSSLQESFARSSEDSEWRNFQARCLNANVNRIHQERLAAMEGLAVLLYYRLVGGVCRLDYMLILLAFSSTKSFFRFSEGGRLSQLAGLICAECMGLWRILEDNNDNSVQWLGSHPLMVGVLPGTSGDTSISGKQAENELEALSEFVLKNAEQVNNDEVNSPESLALLTFGITFHLTYNSILASPLGIDQTGYWQLLGEKGRIMVNTATEEHTALDTLSSTMRALVMNPSKGTIVDGHNELSYNWILATGRETASPMEVQNDDGEMEMDAGSLLYASIGHEVLVALVTAFQDTILSADSPSACENLSMVCDLASLIYRNSPMLCEPFWSDWETATAPGATGTAPPLCRVMDSAFLLVTNAVKIEESGGIGKEQLLATTAPLFQLLATMCYNADKVEFALTALAPAVIQKTFSFVASAGKDGDIAFKQNRLRFLNSFGALARVGDSRECRSIIRECLEQSVDMEFAAAPTGPTLLLHSLALPDPECNEIVLSIIADLLPGASVEWAWAFAHGFERLGSSKSFAEKSLVHPLVRVFNGLVACLGPVAFSENMSDREIESYLTLIWSGVVRLSSHLSECMSNVSREQIPLATVSVILDFLTSCLRELGPITLVHKSITVQSTALGIRDAMVEMLARTSNLGESIVYYALLPISMSVGFAIEAFAQERAIIQCASTEESGSKTSKYGMWRSTVSGRVSSPTKDSETQFGVSQLVENAEIDFEMIEERGGAPHDDFINTAKKALVLLKMWATASLPAGATNNLGELDREQRSHIASHSPHRMLAVSAAIPQPLRAKKNVKNYWDSANPTNLQLIARYLDVDTGRNVWPFDFSALCLDVVHATVAHENISDSPLFHPTAHLLPQIISLATKTLQESAENEERTENAILGILSLRVLCCTTEVLTSNSGVRFSVDELMTSALAKIRSVADALYEARETHGGRLGEDYTLRDDLLFVGPCLQFAATQLEGKHFQNDCAIFPSLAKVILQQAHTKVDEQSPSEGSCLFSFLASVVDFLRLATEITKNEALMRMWQDNAIQLVSMPRFFMNIESCGNLGEAVADFVSFAAPLKSSRIISAGPMLLNRLFPILAVGDSQFFNVDIPSTTKLLSSLSDESDCSQGYREKLCAAALSHHALISQLSLLCNWRKCIDVLLRISKQSQSSSAPGSPPGTLASLGGNDKFLSSTGETACVFRDNLVNIEQSQRSGILLLQEEIDQMAEGMAGLILQLVAESTENANSASPDHLMEVLGLISLCANKLFPLMGNADNCSRVENTLLATAVGILNLLESGGIIGSSFQEGALNVIVNQLLGTVSEMFKLFQIHPDCSNRRDSIKSCVVLLTVLANKGIPYQMVGNERTSAFDLYKPFKDLQIMPMLVSLASSFTTAVNGDTGKTSEANIDILESIVDLVCLLSQGSARSGESGLLEICLSSGALALLARNPLFDRSRKLWSSEDSDSTPSFSLRGYIPTKDNSHQAHSDGSHTPLFAGKDDPLHVLWRNTLRCFKTVLRSSRQDPMLETSRKERFQTLVADFMVSHRPTMLTCLKQLQSQAFTRNALEEATLTLSLLQELVARPYPNRNAHRLISEEFLPLAVSLIARLGSFLGSSSGARDYFDDLEDESDDDVNLGTSRHSPFNRVYNPKHEAIRYSHFASRLCVAVTSEDLATSINASDEAKSAVSSLEKNGKALMTCGFARAMERSAAESMFTALSLVWELHPANSSFHMLTPSEVGKIPIMHLVRPGMIVAFSSDRESKRVRHAGSSVTYIHFAEVQYCDTLDKTWYCRDLETRESEIVKENQILGLEDTSKRQFLTTFAPAPDSAAELENSAASASVGSLILCLRWCAGAVSSTSPTSPIVTMLAGLSTAVIGAEMSSHDRLGSAKKQTAEDVNRLDMQLLEFYGENGAYSKVFRDMLGERSWQTIREQLREELTRAEERENTMATNDDMLVDDSIFLRSSGRNPFNDLRMNYT